MSKTKKKQIFLLITILLLLLISLSYITFTKDNIIHKNLRKLNIDTTYIMIVAHTDDEILLGGAHLINE